MKMNIVVVEPGKEPYVKVINGNLKSMQEIVGGYIECFYFQKDCVACVFNEDGAMMRLESNRPLYEGTYPILGTFFVVGTGPDDFGSLTKTKIAKYMAAYAL